MSSMTRRLIMLSALMVAGSAPAQMASGPANNVAVSPAPTLVTATRYGQSDIGYALADWRRLRASDGYAFADYARFLAANRGWPGEAALRKAAEKAMRPGENATTVLGFFSAAQPVTGNGWARLAEAELASGRATDAQSAARWAWRAADLSAFDESTLFGRFASQLTSADHDARVDALLYARQTSDAQRMLPWASPVRRAGFLARIALQTGAGDADSQYAPLAADVASDAGLMLDRLRLLRARGDEGSVWALLARDHHFIHRPADPERWYDLLAQVARAANANRRYQTAYDVARQTDDAVAPGTDLSKLSYAIRDDYTTLTWIAGVDALRRLGRPADAVLLFDHYSHGGKSLQVMAKGNYWAGRAALQAGRYADATAYWQRAAASPDVFYGQLALERLGQSLPPPPHSAPLPLTDPQRTAFQDNRLLRAIRQLGAEGRHDDQTLFIRALADTDLTATQRQLAAEVAPLIGRPDLAVWIGRSARNNGVSFYDAATYPIHMFQLSSGRSWSLAHGITRQESSFDRNAISHAGARGMMQLMPGTARDQARKLGVGYDGGRLTSDPSYNVMLGSAYFQHLLDDWGGSVPLAVAAYNAGSGNVGKWVRAYGDPRTGAVDMLDWIEAIPFDETRGYVQRVLENTVVYDRLNPSPTTPGAVHLSAWLGKSKPG